MVGKWRDSGYMQPTLGLLIACLLPCKVRYCRWDENAFWPFFCLKTTITVLWLLSWNQKNGLKAFSSHLQHLTSSRQKECFFSPHRLLKNWPPRCLSSIKKALKKNNAKNPSQIGLQRSLFFWSWWTTIFGSCFLWQLDEHSCRRYRFCNMCLRVLHINKTWLLNLLQSVKH